MPGFRSHRTKDITGPWPGREESEPFRATIITSLSFEEIDAIPLNREASYAELWQSIAPYVLSWNVEGRNRETGEYEPLPPPAEAGPEIFRKVDPQIATLIGLHLKSVHRGNTEAREEKKDSTESTPDGKNGTDSDSTPPESAPSSQTDSM